MIDAIYTDGLARLDAFPAATRVGNVLNITAQAPLGINWNVLSIGDLAGQIKDCFNNISRTLEQVGGTLHDLTATVAYNVGLSDESSGIYMRTMTELIESGIIRPHATTLVGVTRLPHRDMLIEFAAIAVIGSNSRP